MKFKYENLNNGAKRTVNRLIEGLTTVLTRKSFSSVTINEVCEEAGYPRATLYNYFDDKYDMIDYLWEYVFLKLNIPEANFSFDEENRYKYLELFYDYFAANEERFRMLINKNEQDDYVQTSLMYFIRKKLMQGVSESQYNTMDTIIPYELGIEYFSVIIFIVVDWVFIKGHNLTKEETSAYFNSLISEKYKIEKTIGK